MKNDSLSLVTAKKQAAQILACFLLAVLWVSAATAAETITPRVLKTHPHDRRAFTQGLTFHNGTFIESTGLRGSSVLRRVEPETGKMLQEHRLHPRYFGEGSTVLDDHIYMLTWRAGTVFVFDAATLRLLRRMRYTGEGWGLTTNGTHLVMSDGGAVLTFRDPETFRVVRRVAVMDGARPLAKLNELEWVEGKIFANIFPGNTIAVIDPASGAVLQRINLKGIIPRQPWFNAETVPNGIAWDAEGKRLFITGKLWPVLLEIAVPGFTQP